MKCENKYRYVSWIPEWWMMLQSYYIQSMINKKKQTVKLQLLQEESSTKTEEVFHVTGRNEAILSCLNWEHCILTSGITVWYGNRSGQDRKCLDKHCVRSHMPGATVPWWHLQHETKEEGDTRFFETCILKGLDVKIGIIVFVCIVFERPFVVLVGFIATVGFPALMESENL